MARIAGVNIPDEKRIEASLTYIKGIGLSNSQKILKSLGINPDIRTKELNDAEINKIREYIEKNFIVEADLIRRVSSNISRLKEINCYRGLRHKLGLPARGQKTRTNARTKKGKKVTVGSGRKKAAAKT
ncbi:MAG: 30S ribosomal protein S13 [Patescibacteria group bacterium]|nr:30S ribosomal protein S13 [Patescibacteria group bacterium]MCL5093808.1 30S ribosomal protein S13 [Patescibacteria group bacterium]